MMVPQLMTGQRFDEEIRLVAASIWPARLFVESMRAATTRMTIAANTRYGRSIPAAVASRMRMNPTKNQRMM